jgi:hypothetical protein
MSGTGQYAIPLFSLIDRSKVDLSHPLPEALGDQLAFFLNAKFGVEALSSQLLKMGDADAYLVLHEVPASSLPALCSLVDVQRTQLYKYERSDQDTVTLTPLNVKID